MAKTYEEALQAEIDQAEDTVFKLYQQIEHLEARAEGLKQALELYRGSAREERTTETAATARPGALATIQRRPKHSGAKFDEVMKFIIATGDKGASIEEMHRFATEHGLRLKRTSIRSNVWNHKKQGKLEAMGEGRYRVVKPTITVPSVAATPASDNITGRHIGPEPVAKFEFFAAAKGPSA